MSKLNIKPLADRVLVEPAAAETKTSSGIIIPDTAKEKPQKGKIVAVGPGTKENPVTLKVGDVVNGFACVAKGDTCNTFKVHQPRRLHRPHRSKQPTRQLRRAF